MVRRRSGPFYSKATRIDSRVRTAAADFEVQGNILIDSGRLPFHARRQGNVPYVRGRTCAARDSPRGGFARAHKKKAQRRGKRDRQAERAPAFARVDKSFPKGWQMIAVRNPKTDNRSCVSFAPRSGATPVTPSPASRRRLVHEASSSIASPSNSSFTRSYSARDDAPGSRSGRSAQWMKSFSETSPQRRRFKARRTFAPYEAPPVAKARKRLIQLMWQVEPTRNTYFELGTEWRDV